MKVKTMGRGQAVALRHYVRRVEPHAFIMTIRTREIIGKGSRSD